MESAEELNNLGLDLQSLGRLEDAIARFRGALEIRPAYAIALTNLGVALAAIGRHEEAIESYNRALELDVADFETRNNLGAALHAIGRKEEAIACFRQAIALAPEFPEARLNLASALADENRPDEALEHYEAALVLRPGEAETHLKLAHVLRKLDRHDDAADHFRQASDLDPMSAEARGGLGLVLQEQGDIDGARALFRHAIALEPRRFAHYLNLARITRLAPDDPVLPALLEIASDVDSLSDDDRINAHFALGNVLSDLGRRDQAFVHLLAGNAARRNHIDYDEGRALRALQRIKDANTSDRFARWPTIVGPSMRPIFIVGFPRSGSTLVEQILAKHPMVACAGEAKAFRQALQTFRADHAEWRFSDPKFIPTADQLGQLSTQYIDALASIAGPKAGLAARITDKMLSNFRYLGLINRLFPHAAIIHTFRDPIETCLSCFSINFTDQPFAFDLGELGRYYRGYATLMRHWKRILPEGAIFDVRYEAVARDFERSAKAIVARCGLDWDDACLRFHEADRPVRTASVEQVRRPIYQTSIRRWRPDAATLAPLLKGLGLN